MTFSDGAGQDELVNPVLDIATGLPNLPASGTFPYANAHWLTTGGGTVLAVDNVQFMGTVTGIRFSISAESSIRLYSLSGTLACFAAGTQIATPGGQRAVQHLKIGDTVLTADGDTRAVKWVGRQSMDTTLGMPEHMRPVRITAGVLGDGVPVRYLVVTADHGMLLDGLLVNAGARVNGETILFDTVTAHVSPFTVYHVETEDHAIILAEGAAAETYLDNATRENFDNYAEYVDLYGTGDVTPELPMPRISAARLLPKALSERLMPPRAA